MKVTLMTTASASSLPTQRARAPRFTITTFGVIWTCLAILMFVVVLLPLLYTLDIAFREETMTGLSDNRSLEAFINVYTKPEYLLLLLNAVVLAAIVTAVSMLFGVTLALLVARSDIKFKGAVDMLVILPLFLSPLTGLIAWIVLGSGRTGLLNVLLSEIFDSTVRPFNIWSNVGIVWVMFLFFCPFAYLFTLGSLKSMDSALEEAARISGATVLQTIFKVTLPMSLPALFAAGLLIFILATEVYIIPGIIGSNTGFITLPWRIYQDARIFPPAQAHAAAAGTILMLITMIGLVIQHRITRMSDRYVTVGGKGFRGTPLRLGKLAWLAYGIILVYVFSAVILPFIALILASFMKYASVDFAGDIWTLGQYLQMFTIRDFQVSLTNTLILAVLTGVLCVIIGLVISFAEVRRPNGGTRLLAFIGILPVAVPGIIYGMGILWVYLRTPLYGSIWVLLLAYVAKLLPYGILVSRSGVLQIHPDLEKSARMSGATQMQALRFISAPLMRDTLVAVMFFVMIMAMNEVSASLLLATGQNKVLSVLTFGFMDTGNYQLASAITLAQTLLMVGIIVITRAVFKVRIEGVVTR